MLSDVTDTTKRTAPHFATGRSINPALLCVFAFALLAIAAYLPRLLLFAQSMYWEQLLPIATNRDFANYWLAGRMVLEGQQLDLFTQYIYYARMQEVFGPGYPLHNWGYPPHFLLLLWPLGLLEYKLALIVFLVSTLALFLVAVAVFRRTYAVRSDWKILILALLGYALMMVDAAQNGFLLAAVLLFGLTAMKSRPVLAGLAFGILTVKPQLGILIPVLLAFDRNWKTIGWSAVFTLMLVALSAAIFGFASWSAYLTDTLAYQRAVMTNWTGIFLMMMPTTFASARVLGLSPQLAYLIQWPVSIAGAVLVLWLLWKEKDALRRLFVLTCGTFVISPYAFNYDMGALCVVAALLVGSQRVNRSSTIAISIVAGLPAAVMNLGRSNVPIAPALLCAALIAVAWELRSVSVPRTAAHGDIAV